MLPVITLLIIALSSLVVTRIATVALTLTGLSQESARFQARSALTTAGFTTSESELILNHPVRRRIIMTLMFIGSAGLVSVIATLSSTFVTAGDATSLGSRVGTLIVGMFFVYRLADSKLFDRMLQPIMRRVLERMTDLEVRDYAALLNIAGDYAVMELQIQEGDWVANQSLMDLRLPDEGILVLGIIRDANTYIGAPEGGTVIQPGEVLVLYGRRQRLSELDQRDKVSGETLHEAATLEQDAIEATQDPIPKARAARQAMQRTATRARAARSERDASRRRPRPPS